MRWLIASVMLIPWPMLALAHGEWIRVEHGCEVWNRDPRPGESATWSGSCRDGKATGFGVLRWLEKGIEVSRYEGDLVAGKREGPGLYQWASGDRYLGDFREGSRTGYGLYVYANGDRYEGEFREGKRHGHGVYVFAEGGRYAGPFWLGDRHGTGQCYTPGRGWVTCRWRYDSQVP